MTSDDRSRNPRRRYLPTLDGLESRALLSFTLVRTPVHAAAAVARPVAAADVTAAVPTPHEAARQRYVARFKGSYTLGPGRYSDQAAQLFSRGYGGANQSLHLWSQLRITVPTDPTAPVTGLVGLTPWNVATTGSNLVLDLTGDPASAVNGIPTRYTWTVDPSSSGIYANAGDYGQGQGTLDLKFFPARPAGAALARSGQLQFAVNGFINTSGVTNVLNVLGNVSTDARLGKP